MARPFKPESLVLGVLLVAVGSVWMAANLGKLDLLSTLRTFWPASLVLWGVVELLAVVLDRAREKAATQGGDARGGPEEGSEK